MQFWPPAEIEAYFSRVEHGKLIVLDLDGLAGRPNAWQQWANASRPAISCLLDNFGGTRAFEGPLQQAAHEPLADLHAAPAGAIAGIGWAPEDTHANPIVWQLLSEAAWRGPDLAIGDVAAWVDAW